MRIDTGIVHLRVTAAGTLSAFLARADFSPLPIEPTPPLVAEWLHYGAVYVDGLRTREDRELAPEQILRVHTRRKNYVSEDLRLAPSIVLDQEEFLVLDKPAGLPTHPTLDNYVQNAQYMLARELGHPIYVTHRLDIATQGLLVLAKSPRAQGLVNKQFREGRVRKTYRATTEGALPVGLHTHYMDPESRVPKIVSASPREGWWECRLEVLRAQENSSEIRLLTGKTHQIRAQAGALGAPIVGDKTYGARTEFGEPLGIALECYRLEFQFRSPRFDVVRPRPLVEL